MSYFHVSSFGKIKTLDFFDFFIIRNEFYTMDMQICQLETSSTLKTKTVCFQFWKNKTSCNFDFSTFRNEFHTTDAQTINQKQVQH